MLARGAGVGIAAGIFLVVGLLFILHGFAWLTWYALFSPSTTYFWGFFIVAGVLFLLGALAGFLASRAFKSGSPPTPELAIDEAKRIKETVTSEHPERTILMPRPAPPRRSARRSRPTASSSRTRSCACAARWPRSPTGAGRSSSTRSRS